ncbi:MAG: SAM-dependent chlorinase/fluorinase, partial [Deltaproteobacteria bacterium]|nr:SAM-dependent chlorinase/fluorinase [Deltaproteobacteria bacterium]
PKPAFFNGLLSSARGHRPPAARTPPYPPPPPLITRRTDFGTRDAYVASLKGVILSLKPAAQLMDLSHEVASHHTLAGPAVTG